MNEARLTVELVDASVGANRREHRAAAVAACIRRFGGYVWVGVYDVGPGEIAVIGCKSEARPPALVDDGATAAQSCASGTTMRGCAN